MKRERKYYRNVSVKELKEQIEKQGGVATLQQKSLLANNRLKKLRFKIDALLLKTMKPNNKISDKDILTIISAIKIIENKFKPILKKKQL